MVALTLILNIRVEKITNVNVNDIAWSENEKTVVVRVPHPVVRWIDEEAISETEVIVSQLLIFLFVFPPSSQFIDTGFNDRRRSRSPRIDRDRRERERSKHRSRSRDRKRKRSRDRGDRDLDDMDRRGKSEVTFRTVVTGLSNHSFSFSHSDETARLKESIAGQKRPGKG